MGSLSALYCPMPQLAAFDIICAMTGRYVAVSEL